MGVEKTGYGRDAGAKVPTPIILLGVLVFAIVMAMAAKHDADNRQQPGQTPRPSASASA